MNMWTWQRFFGTGVKDISMPYRCWENCEYVVKITYKNRATKYKRFEIKDSTQEANQKAFVRASEYYNRVHRKIR